jgi:protein O-mannosyl-transferase
LRLTRIGVAAGLIALVAAAYSGVVELGFLTFDDDGYVTKNPMVLDGLTPRAVWAAFSQFHAQNWHPLTWLSHMLDVSLYGLWPAGHHLTSVALHAANAVGVFLVLERLTGATWRAAFAAALFAVHPLRVESVAWIAERKDVLSTCFGLAALYAWSSRSYWTSVALFAVSLCAKPMLVTFPFLLLVLDWWPLRRLDSPRALAALAREKWPFFALSLGSCVVTLFAQRQAMGYAPLPLRLANSIAAIQEYLYRVADPRELYAMYLYRGSYGAGEIALDLLLVAALSALALWQARQRPWLLCGWLWFTGTLVPTLGIVQVGVQAFADRYTYFPFVGLALIAAFAGGELAERVRFGRALAAAAAALVLAACVVQTRAQVPVWRDQISLFEHAIALDPANWYAHTELGIAVAESGDLARGKAELEEAVRLRPGHARALGNLAMAEADHGDPERALALIDRGLEIDPNLSGATLVRAIALEKTGRYFAAEQAYRRALELEPDTRETAFRLARLLSVLPDPALRDGAEASALCERACAARPCELAEELDVCAMAAMEAGRQAEAIEKATRAVDLARERGDAALARRIAGRLAAYQRGQPTRLNATPSGVAPER